MKIDKYGLPDKPTSVKMPPINNNVDHPKHYNQHPSGVECIEITQHYDFCIGNAIKYLWRAGIKNQHTTVEDLKKAIWYINKKIEMCVDKNENK